MPELKPIGEVLCRMGVPPGALCLDPDCEEPADGLHGFCIACSRKRERDGRFETLRLFDERSNDGEEATQ
jgi:hypothetical protein